MSGKMTIALLAVAAAFGSASAQAQVALDVTKITCDQYVHSKISTPPYIAAWLSGYYHGQRGSLTLDPQTLQANVNKLQEYCYVQDNWNVPVIKAVEKLVGTDK
jgi:acid stress chaperone HdeB